MARKITKLGHTVKGALGAYIRPRLAADAAFKPGELDQLLKEVPVASFKEQIPLITKSVKTTFKDRFAADSKLDDLEEMLEELQEGDDPDDLEEGEDKKAKDKKGGATDEDDMGEDAEENPGEKLMKMLGTYDIPDDDLETLNGLISSMSKAGGKDKKAKDEKKDSKMKDEKKDGKKDDKNDAPMKEVPVTKPAMDAAIKLASDTAAKETRKQLAELYDAAAKVKPYVGDINVLAFDSASSIFKMALDAHEVETKDVHPSAYSSLLQLIDAKTTRASSPALATDAASQADFEKRYTHIPARA
jgi:hypothetical protein